MPRIRRVLLAGDLHCGHRVGLTPPGWQLRPIEDEPKRMKWLKIQQECWKWFAKTINRLKPIEIAVWNGDLIDGTGHRSGGTELICTDRNQQIEMALKAIRFVGAQTNIIVAGTPYHSGEQEDMEELIAAELHCKFGSHEWLDINGVCFDVKHFIGASSIPHGRLTALSRDSLWNSLWAEAGDTPKADYIVRSHVHYTTGGWDFTAGKRVDFFTLPALQAMGTKYGARKCSGKVNFGFHTFDIGKEGVEAWGMWVPPIESQKVMALVL